MCVLRYIVIMIIIAILWRIEGTCGIRFEISKEECVSHKVESEGNTLQISFVLIKAESPSHVADKAVNLMIKGPSGELLHDLRDKTSEKHEFVVYEKGLYQFCFANKSPYLVTIDFDVHLGHFTYYDQHAKDEHFNPLLDQISELEKALYSIHFEQHWLEAQTDRQVIVNDKMSKRALQKAMIESAALVGASVLQMYLMRRLFDRKLGISRV